MALADLGFTMTPMLDQLPPELKFNPFKPRIGTGGLDQFGRAPSGPMGMGMLSDEIDVTAEPMPLSMSPAGAASGGVSALPMDPMQLPQGPGIPTMETLPKPTWLDKWAASDRVPTFGMTGLDHEAKKAAIKAGLMRSGASLLSTMGPGNQNFMGNLGTALGAGMDSYRGVLGDSEGARRADESFALEKERHDYNIQAAKDEAAKAAATEEEDKGERQRIMGNLTDEQQGLMDPFIAAPDKDWYDRLDAITTDEQKDEIIRVIGGRGYRIGAEGPAEMIGGIVPPSEEGPGRVDLAKISTEARQLAMAQYQAELKQQERSRDWADDKSKFPETVPTNRFEQLYQEKLKMLEGLLGGETSRGGGGERPTAAEGRETAGPASVIDEIDAMGLPDDATAEFKRIAADLEAQGKSQEEIRAMLQAAMQAGV